MTAAISSVLIIAAIGAICSKSSWTGFGFAIAVASLTGGVLLATFWVLGLLP